VGGTEEKHVDTRIIAATNANLEKAIQGGRLREDLYHRLKVIQVHLPPLRERKDDIPALLAYFLDRANGEMNRNISGLSMEARNLILSYHWPGNVRELENAIRSAAAICMDNQIGMEHLPPELERAVCGTNLQNPTTRDLTLANIQPHYSNSLTGGPADFQTLLTNLQEVVRQELTFHIENMGEIEDFDFHSRMLFPIEKILIEAVLDKFNGNQVKTAKFLGINRNTLRSRMEKFNCDLENSKK
jgi:two-component system nitrogen regulation response regulator GlnG